MDKDNFSHSMDGFSKLNKAERLKRLKESGALDAEDISYLTERYALSTELAEKFIENVIGYFPMPLGVAVNLMIDGKELTVPMAVEETSIIAAVSNTAKWIRNNGSISTWSEGSLSIGQIQIANVKNFADFEVLVNKHKNHFIHLANNDVAKGLVSRGGGVKDLILRKIPRPDGQSYMGVIHILVDTCDAMGANIINQICEHLKTPIEELTNEKVSMCILSNLNDNKLSCARVSMQNIDAELGEKLEEASLFAEHDPYRAATNNKGVLNGIDPILIATGNDWRAVEAAIHAYSARDGQYRSITQWRYKNGNLIGEIKAPIVIGITGGVTNLHPSAKLSLKMLKVESASYLARIIAAMGLVQNLGAIKAITTEGIIQGHMRLHIPNLALSAGANSSETHLLESQLRELLKTTKRLSLSHAVGLLNKIRNKEI